MGRMTSHIWKIKMFETTNQDLNMYFISFYIHEVYLMVSFNIFQQKHIPFRSCPGLVSDLASQPLATVEGRFQKSWHQITMVISS